MAKGILKQVEELIRPIDQIGAEAMRQAVLVCRKHKRTLKASFDADEMKKIRAPYYVNRFTVIPMDNAPFGIYGCKLWNEKYPLSHLLENGHEIWNQYGGPYPNVHGKAKGTDKTIAYNEWNPEEQEMIDEFTERLMKYINSL